MLVDFNVSNRELLVRSFDSSAIESKAELLTVVNYLSQLTAVPTCKRDQTGELPPTLVLMLDPCLAILFTRIFQFFVILAHRTIVA